MTFSPSWRLTPPTQPRLDVELPRALHLARVVACVPTLDPEPDSQTIQSIRELGVSEIHFATDHMRRGAAWTRNRAASAANGADWLLFVDDGVLVSQSLINAARRVLAIGPPAAGICGDVVFAGSATADWYNRHRTLVPPVGPGGEPATLTTAAVLVARSAFEAVGGFDERFPSAGAEDFDLGFRLLAVGRIAHAAGDWAVHREDLDEEAAARALVDRFQRYGRGWRVLTEKWNLGPPAPITPMDPITADERHLSKLANDSFRVGVSNGPGQ